MRHLTLITVTAFFICGVAPNVEAAPPTAVSPGEADRFVISADPCPLFSWAATEEAESFELIIMPATTGGRGEINRNEAVHQVRLPGGARAWQPPLGQCLDYGGMFTWSIRETSGSWSDPLLFQVVQQPSRAAMAQATEVLETWLRATASEFEETLEARIDAPLPSFTIAPDVTGVSTMGTTFGGPQVTFGMHGVSQSATADSAGAVGEAQAATGNIGGVIGQVASPDGIAAAFENTAGGWILETRTGATAYFRIDASGNVFAPIFTGKGSGLTGVTHLECSGCVEGSEIVDRSITYIDLAVGSVGQAKILDNAVGNDELGTGAVEADEIAAGAVTANKIVTDAVTSNKLADGAVGSSEIATGAVVNLKIDSDSLTRRNLQGSEKKVYVIPYACPDKDKLTLEAQCSTGPSPCQVAPSTKFYNCIKICNQNSPVLCDNEEAGWLLSATMDP